LTSVSGLRERNPRGEKKKKSDDGGGARVGVALDKRKDTMLPTYKKGLHPDRLRQIACQGEKGEMGDTKEKQTCLKSREMT